MCSNIGYPKQLQTKKYKPKFNKKRYFEWIRLYHGECVVCGGTNLEIHHIDIGVGRDDKRVVPLCSQHHNAQYPNGIHRNEQEWYKTFLSFEGLEEIATRLFEDYKNYEKDK